MYVISMEFLSLSHRRSSSWNVPQRRWARRNVCRSQANIGQARVLCYKERFHLRGQHLSKFIGTRQSILSSGKFFSRLRADGILQILQFWFRGRAVFYDLAQTHTQSLFLKVSFWVRKDWGLSSGARVVSWEGKKEEYMSGFCLLTRAESLAAWFTSLLVVFEWAETYGIRSPPKFMVCILNCSFKFSTSNSWK